MITSIKDVLNFWFGEIRETEEYLQARTQLWFMGDPKTDEMIRQKFEPLLGEFIAGNHGDWCGQPPGRLASIIVLDQFSRNLYRGTPKAFAQDSAALKLALDGIAMQADRLLHPVQRLFFYLPLEHSEDLAIQEQSIKLYAQLLQETPAPIKESFEENLDYAMQHYEIIQKFGRFPHRNKTLSRPSTDEEIEFLKLPGSSF
jgi:uncharacterized protein (DUF924 family)